MLFARELFFAVALILALEINYITCDIFQVIETNDGAIRGVKNTTYSKKVNYYSFKGIPYAEKPIGELRFKAPKPVKPWKPKVLDGLTFGNNCMQLGSLDPNSNEESEDCLYLNIYVPADIKGNEKVPVMFFIHGGGYGRGTGNDFRYGPDFIVEKQVILVTLNYRLNIFGFLSLNSAEYSGNMGLKDQQLALKWIHENIQQFNGDNSKITIFGGSAGSSSTHLQILSTESRKYFQSAIGMSGTAYDYWAMSEDNDHLEMAYEISKKLGKPTAQIDELIEILLSETSENIMKSLLGMFHWDRTMSFLFVPIIERADAIQPFITESIERIYDTQHINITTMFTVASAEMIYSMKSNPVLADIGGLNTNFSIKLPFRGLNLASDSAEYRALNDEIRQFYFGSDDININKSAEYIALFSDINFFYGIDKLAKLHALKSKGKTFYARFSVDSKLNFFKRLFNGSEYSGASHCDDLGYLFRAKQLETVYDDVFNATDDEQSKISIQAIENMNNLFTQFAEMGDSENSKLLDIEFKPIQNGEINFLDITNEGFRAGMDPNGKAMEFWSNIEKRLESHIGYN